MIKVFNLQVLIASLLFAVLVAVVPNAALAGYCEGSKCILLPGPALPGRTQCQDDLQCSPVAAPGTATVGFRRVLLVNKDGSFWSFLFKDVAGNVVLNRSGVVAGRDGASGDSDKENFELTGVPISAVLLEVYPHANENKGYVRCVSNCGPFKLSLQASSFFTISEIKWVWIDDPSGTGGLEPSRGGLPGSPENKAIDFDALQKSIGFKLKSTEGTVFPSTVGGVVSAIVPLLLTLAGILLLLYLLYGGFSLMMSRGDPKAMEAAKGKITNAAIGFAIVFTAYWLIRLLGAILGIEQFKEIFG